MPVPAVPADNPMSAEKAELGRRLFYDPRLSIDEEMSCATCHQQARAFSDGKPRGVGTTGELHPRGPMSLTNVAYAPRLAWANPQLNTLEVQAMLPLFGEEPVEMGMSGQEDLLISRLEADQRYPGWFDGVWPGEQITVAHIVQAIATFQRTLISTASPYDAWTAGDRTALTVEQKHGMTLFFSERLECFHCHGGANFTDTMTHAGMAVEEVGFHNTGLYNTDGAGAYPEDNAGTFEVTGDPVDMGRFKAPTLRNIAVTAPYMHDGSIASLEAVLEHYAQGGRAPASPLRSEFVVGFVLSDSERDDVIAFLGALTDPAFLADPRHADPWK
ncbi:MAG: cytochrome c peroxidase [Myxococcota bacterium]|jgi:cytochrome c peroxidase